MKKIVIITLVALGLFASCKKEVKKVETTKKLAVSKDLKWSERMVLSEINRFPDPTLLDFNKKPKLIQP